MKQLKMYMDSRPADQPEGTYPYGKNGVQHELYENIFNEPGFSKMAAAVPYTLMGKIETDDRPILFSTNDTDSAIGYFNPETGLYEGIVDDNPLVLLNWPATGERLGFKRDNYITGESQRNYKGETVCAFTDKDKFPKYLNCDTPAIKSLDDLRLFPINKPPAIQLSQGLGGTLPAGTYYVALNYEKYDGATTQRSDVSEGVTISPGEFGLDTDKSISISITNVDTDYNFVRISIISRIKGVTKAVEFVDLIPITDTTLDVLYTGDNFTKDIDVSEILTPPANYDQVGCMGQLNDALYLGDLRKEEEINDMQQYANLIGIKWKSELLSAISPPSEHVQGIKKGLMHEEVYALYIQYRRTRGGYTKGFTIPGLTPDAADLVNSTIAVTGGGTVAVPKYKVEDRIHSFDAGTFTGDTGIWQNSVEEYPDTIDFDSTSLGGRNLRGQKVLHHKMPSLRWCKQNLYSSNVEYGKTHLDILGITPSNIIIPAKYVGIIDGYRILYAKRTLSNQTVYGQSVLMHGAVDAFGVASPLNSDVYTTGGNFTSSVWHQGSGDYNNLWQLIGLRKDTMRFHAFDMLYYKPSVSPTYISAQLKLRRQNLRAEGYLEDGSFQGQRFPIVHLIDYTKGVTPTLAPSNFLRSVKSSFYMQNGVSVGRFINGQHETTYAGTLGGDNGLWPLAFGDSGIRIRGQAYTEPEIGSPDFEETYLINLISVKTNLFSSFYSQKLVSAGASRDLADLSTFWGGDTFVCPYTFHTYGRHDIIDTEGAVFGGKKVIRRFICESSSNIHLRYEIPGNIYSQWYPHNNVLPQNPAQCYISFYDRSKDPNQFGYNRDFGALNDFVSSTIFNPAQESLIDFPYRIHRTGKLSRQTRPRNWRTALPLDFYECQKNMGFIINLDGYKDRLIIHHENALFLTQDKAKLETGLLNITLGTGDIFQFEPQPAEDSVLGIGGTQHDLACVKTPIGYVFTDAKQGEVFLYADKLINLTAGANTFLREALKVAAKNTYTGNGILVGWDQKYKRILVTVKYDDSLFDGPVRSFTMSYSLKGKAWVFFHDYVPDMYIHQREQLFSAKDNKIFKHHDGPPGLYYQFPPIPKSFFIDLVFNAETEMLMETVYWNTDYLDASGVEQMFKTFTHISIWNSHQHSGRIPLRDTIDLNIKEMRRTKGEWSFDDFRNILKSKGTAFLEDLFKDYALIDSAADSSLPWYFKETLRDNWFCVRFEYDNSVEAQLILRQANIQVQKSTR